MEGPKWLDAIDLVSHETGGYWEQQGWDHNAIVKTTSRLDAPRDGEIIKLGVIDVGGVAFGGTRGISKVEYTTDGGTNWITAPFDPPPSNLPWVLCHAPLTPPATAASPPTFSPPHPPPPLPA